MTNYVVCPDCGYKLLKAGDGSNIEIHCPKCGAKMTIEIKAVSYTHLDVYKRQSMDCSFCA